MNASVRAALLAGTLVLWLGVVLWEVALVGKLDLQETPVGCAVALLATALTVSAVYLSRVRFDVRLAWLGFAVFVVRNIVRDTVFVFGIVLRRLGGARIADEFRDVPFDPGGDDPQSAARRALVVAGMSTSPNEIALTVDAERHVVRVHVLTANGAGRHSLRWPL